MQRPPFFDRYSQKLSELVPYIDIEELSEQQLWIIHLIYVIGHSRAQIPRIWKQHFGSSLSIEALCTCIKRTGFSYYWEKGMGGGKNEYLCKSDLKLLASEVKEHFHISTVYDVNAICDEAYLLKMERVKKAVDFFTLIKAYQYAEHYSKKLHDETISIPTRQWVNGIIDKLQAKLVYPVFIDSRRFLSCTVANVEDFFYVATPLLNETPIELIFTADETMISGCRKQKVVIPDDSRIFFTMSELELPHMTAMCTVNVIGDKPPLFIILKNLKKIPSELESLVHSSKAWIASTNNGWMDRNSFLMYALHFIAWLSCYREGLPSRIKDHSALLILDGHRSRENPLALELFTFYNIKVLILPSHMTHILQMFDVSLASPLKTLFSKLLRQLLQNKDFLLNAGSNETSKLRKAQIEAFVEAWDITATKSKCISAAAAVGINPVNAEKPKQSKWVKDALSPEQQRIVEERQRARQDIFNISNKEITKPENIDAIREMVQKSGKFPFLVRHLNEFDFMSLIGEAFFNRATSRMLASCQRYGQMNFIDLYK